MLDYIHLGKKIYNTDNPREARRMAVFVVRCLLNNSRMQRLHQFFSQNDLYRKIAEGSFPRQITISVHGTGWHESAVDRWIANPAAYRVDRAE